MMQLINGVKANKSNFIEQMRDEQRQLQLSAQQLYGPYAHSQKDLHEPSEVIEQRWQGHPELLPSNGGPTMHRSEMYEDDDGSMSQNPYYNRLAGIQGLAEPGQDGLGGTNKYARMLRN